MRCFFAEVKVILSAGLKPLAAQLYKKRRLILEEKQMNRLFMGLLAVAALALIVSQATAGANNAANAANEADNDGVMIIETYTASSVTLPAGNNGSSSGNGSAGDMQPLPGDPGVEVAPVNSAAQQPAVVEEDVLVQETEDGE